MIKNPCSYILSVLTITFVLLLIRAHVIPTITSMSSHAILIASTFPAIISSLMFATDGLTTHLVIINLSSNYIIFAGVLESLPITSKQQNIEDLTFTTARKSSHCRIIPCPSKLHSSNLYPNQSNSSAYLISTHIIILLPNNAYFLAVKSND